MLQTKGTLRPGWAIPIIRNIEKNLCGSCIAYSDTTPYRDFNETDMQAIVNDGSKLFGNCEKYLTLRNGADGELEAVSVIPNPFLSRITNSEGLLQIGDEVRRYFYDYYLTVISPSTVQIEALKEVKEGKVPAFSQKIEIYRHDIKDLAKTTCGGNTNAKPQYASSPKRRINATLRYECTNVGGPNYLQSFYSEVKNQRKNVGIWWAREADEINTSVTGSTNNQSAWTIGPWDTGSSDGTVTNDNKIDLFFAYFYTDACYPYINAVTYDFDGDHDLTDKNGSSTGSTSNDRYCN